MNILVDENIPMRTVRALRQMGHTVLDVRGTQAEASGDDELFALAQSHRALLVTTDKGFARRRGEPHQGMLIVRLRQPSRFRIDERIQQAMRFLSETDWPGLLLVLRDRTFSMWRQPDSRKRDSQTSGDSP